MPSGATTFPKWSSTGARSEGPPQPGNSFEPNRKWWSWNPIGNLQQLHHRSTNLRPSAEPRCAFCWLLLHQRYAKAGARWLPGSNQVWQFQRLPGRRQTLRQNHDCLRNGRRGGKKVTTPLQHQSLGVHSGDRGHRRWTRAIPWGNWSSHVQERGALSRREDFRPNGTSHRER